MSRERDTFDMFEDRPRGRFGDGEASDTPIRCNADARSNLVDLDMVLHNDNPAKKAFAVSFAADTAFAQWIWLPRSLAEFEKTGIGKAKEALVRVTLPERLAKEKGLI